MGGFLDFLKNNNETACVFESGYGFVCICKVSVDTIQRPDSLKPSDFRVFNTLITFPSQQHRKECLLVVGIILTFNNILNSSAPEGTGVLGPFGIKRQKQLWAVSCFLGVLFVSVLFWFVCFSLAMCLFLFL